MLAEVFQALAVARSVFRVREACSRFRVSNHQRKRQQAGRSSKRFARFGCGSAGYAALRSIADFQSAGLEMSDHGASREVPKAGSTEVQMLGTQLEICA